jgi:hypothetical protein
MASYPITSWERVGELWLPWPTKTLPEPTIQEVITNPRHPALVAVHPDHGRWRHADRIQHYVNRLEIGLSAGARRFRNGFMLEDGCHRACALYRVRPHHWELVLRIG